LFQIKARRILVKSHTQHPIPIKKNQRTENVPVILSKIAIAVNLNSLQNKTPLNPKIYKRSCGHITSEKLDQITLKFPKLRPSPHIALNF